MRKKKSIKNSHNNAVAALTQYIQLVIQGLRDAYLVDNCCLAFDEIFKICQSIVCCSSAASSSSQSSSLSPSDTYNTNSTTPKIILLRLHQDVMIINPVIFKQKMNLLKSNDWSTSHLFLINVDGSIPVICTDSQINLITSTLIDTLTQNQWFDICGVDLEHRQNDMISSYGAGTNNTTSSSIQVLEFIETKDFLTFVGFPFLAGWLLGYPCLYLSTQVMNALSGQQLHKISISVVSKDTINNHSSNTLLPSSTPIESALNNNMIDIQIFTIPLSILDESVAEIHINEESYIQPSDDGASSFANRILLQKFLNLRKCQLEECLVNDTSSDSDNINSNNGKHENAAISCHNNNNHNNYAKIQQYYSSDKYSIVITEETFCHESILL